MVTKLLPCPFCGNATPERYWHDTGFAIECGNQDCPIKVWGFRDAASAATAWNTRPGRCDDSELLDKALADLEKATNELAAKDKPCAWERDQYCDCWDTACGENFVIESGTPKENNMRFCCFCGGPLIEFCVEPEAEQQP